MCVVNMTRSWRTSRVDQKESKGKEFELGYVFERMVKGMRNEMNTVLWKIERSRDLSPEGIRCMLKNGLESMVGAVEKVMNGVSDGMAKEWRVKDKEEKESEDRARKLEDQREREARDREERGRKVEERMKVLEERIEEKASDKKVRMMGDKIERDRKDGEEETRGLSERIRKLEERVVNEVQKTEKDNRERQERIDKVEADIIKERKERQEFERKQKDYLESKDMMEQKKEMERKMELAMEQIKILNLDFGRECNERKTVVEEAVRKLQEKVSVHDREEFERIMRGTKVSVLGNSTSVKEVEKGKIHTVPILLACWCKNAKERLEDIVKRAGIFVSVQWPKESLNFVKELREKVEQMGYERKTYFARIRPTVVEGTVYIRVDVKRKEGGNFERLAYWSIPTRDKRSMEPKWMAGKRK